MRDTVGENREEQETHGLILAHFKAFSPEKKNISTHTMEIKSN